MAVKRWTDSAGIGDGYLLRGIIGKKASNPLTGIS